MKVAAAATTVCYNCGEPLSGAFCSQCGQKSGPLDPTFRDLLFELAHEMLDVDGRIFRSVRKLLAAPGFLTREHFAGRRARWISPLRLYLVFSVIYFGMASLAGRMSGVQIRVSGTDQETAAQLKRLGFESEEQLQEAVSQALTTWTPRVMFVLVPLFAWFVLLACRRSRRNYPQHLYFALHVHAAWFAAGAVAAAVQLTGVTRLEIATQIVVLGYALWYLLAALRNAYALSWRTAVLRGAALAIGYMVVVWGAIVAIVLPAVLGRG